MTQDAITAALLVQNRDRCQPPLEEDEVERIATSIARYEPEGKQQNTPLATLSSEEKNYIARWERHPVRGVWAVGLFEAFFNEFLNTTQRYGVCLGAVGSRNSHV